MPKEMKVLFPKPTWSPIIKKKKTKNQVKKTVRRMWRWEMKQQMELK